MRSSGQPVRDQLKKKKEKQKQKQKGNNFINFSNFKLSKMKNERWS